MPEGRLCTRPFAVPALPCSMLPLHARAASVDVDSASDARQAVHAQQKAELEQAEDDEEWLGWVNWDALCEEGAGVQANNPNNGAAITAVMADALRVVEAWLIHTERARLRALCAAPRHSAEFPPPYVNATSCGSAERKHCPLRLRYDYAYYWWCGTALRKCIECNNRHHSHDCKASAQIRVVRKIKLVRVRLCRGGADPVEYSGPYMCASCRLPMQRCGGFM